MNIESILRDATRTILPDRTLSPLPESWTSLSSAYLFEMRRNTCPISIKDTTGVALSPAEELARVAAIARVLSLKLGKRERVGVILPPTAAGNLVNKALTLLNRVPVNLNYGANTEIINYCIGKCEIEDVIASTELLSKLGLQPSARLITPEELVAAIDGDVKTWVAQALSAPATELPGFFPGLTATLDDLATLLLTTGLTGRPKAVELTHRSILVNMLAIRDQYEFGADEVILGTAPLFHALGFTGTVWAPSFLRVRVVHHANSRDPRKVCELVETEKVTIILTTPTLMRLYLLRATKEKFASVKHLVLGAEKLKPALAQKIQETLGICPEEAFGATEFGPLVSANVNANVRLDSGKVVWGNRLGSAGMAVPGTALAICDIETGALLPRGKANVGLIYARGPQMMRRYLNDPEKTAKAIISGWYYTGDVGYIDEDGFLYILDRLSRFAKIGGEMVPLETVETTMLGITGTDETSLYIVNIPDESKGERLVVFYTEIGMTPQELVSKLSEKLPTLWIPSAAYFIAIDKLPIGATNKINIQELKQLALAKFGDGQ